MPKDGKKIAIGAGIAGILGLLYALTRKAKAAPPPPPPPGLANLYGKVTDSQTGAAIPNVLVSLDGIQVYTDSGGNYALTNLDIRAYSIIFQKGGYNTMSQSITLSEGNNQLNVAMTPIYVPPAVANLYGVVTDAQTGYALQGVKVTIAGLTTYTDANGNYGFTGLTPGSYTITFTKTGYETLVR